MTKLLIFVGTLVCGYGAGWLFSGYGMMAEFIASGFGSLVGVYLGWKLARMIEG